jgi:hypothetical protein
MKNGKMEREGKEEEISPFNRVLHPPLHMSHPEK